MTQPQVTPAQQQRYTELLHQIRPMLIGAMLIGAAPPGRRNLDVIAKIMPGAQDLAQP